MGRQQLSSIGYRFSLHVARRTNCLIGHRFAHHFTYYGKQAVSNWPLVRSPHDVTPGDTLPIGCRFVCRETVSAGHLISCQFSEQAISDRPPVCSQPRVTPSDPLLIGCWFVGCDAVSLVGYQSARHIVLFDSAGGSKEHLYRHSREATSRRQQRLCLRSSPVPALLHPRAAVTLCRQCRTLRGGTVVCACARTECDHYALCT